MPSQIAAEKAAAGGVEVVETAEKAATQMAEQAGEHPTKVNKLTHTERIDRECPVYHLLKRISPLQQ